MNQWEQQQQQRPTEETFLGRLAFLGCGSLAFFDEEVDGDESRGRPALALDDDDDDEELMMIERVG